MRRFRLSKIIIRHVLHRHFPAVRSTENDCKFKSPNNVERYEFKGNKMFQL